MKAKTAALLSLVLCVVLAAAAVALLAAHGAKDRGRGSAAEETTVPNAGAVEVMAVTEPEAEQVQEEAQAQEPAPTAPLSQTVVVRTRESGDPTVPEQSDPIPDDYFSDAAFVGNSIVTGLDMYDYDGVLDGAAFYAANSVTVLTVSEYLGEMKGDVYGKVYIGLGTNELAYDKEELRDCFLSAIEVLRGYNPDCIIYLMAVPPVSRYKATNSSSFTRLLVLEFNQMLYEIARDEGVWYLDVYSVLCDDEGYLPADVTVDGVHFTPDHYRAWFELLDTHYVT